MSYPAFESAIGEFRRWFAAAVAANGETPPPAAEPSLDLATLLGHFVALRQEVNLQTRAVRAQQEQNAETIERLGQAVEVLSRPRPEPTDDKQKPLLTSLVEVCDALLLAHREVQKQRDILEPALDELAAPPPRASFLARWVGKPISTPATIAVGRLRGTLSAVVTGYGMSLERAERALRKHGLEPIAAVGRTFDAERMEAVDAVEGSGRPAGEVVEELQRGYLRDGRVFRFAQVRVARG